MTRVSTPVEALENMKPNLLLYLSLVIAGIVFIFFMNRSRVDDPNADSLIARGESIYRTNCIACHNPDPKKDGAIGPAIYGSSQELLEARVIKASYLDEYQPKRTTHIMPAMPHLAGGIEALHAFLNQ
ncbi:MAG: hypothetical protein ACD_73C00575G0002 [uncultured bacterium]|nr:MAG: hypothetical protein ACD_73C00575G0002 [uncultured bacterium]